jgi:hypothetical protein
VNDAPIRPVESKQITQISTVASATADGLLTISVVYESVVPYFLIVET